MTIKESLPISELTTMKLGGKARYVINITSKDELSTAYNFAKEQNLPTYIVAGGSNIIAKDEDYNGVILLNNIKGIRTTKESNSTIKFEVGSGEVLDDVCANVSKKGFTGMEAMSAIPGTIGGAVIQNSGAYGQDISKILVSVEAYDISARKNITIPKHKIEYGYRNSIFNSSKKGRYFITAVCVKLKKGEIKGELYRSLQGYLDDNNIAERTPNIIRQAVSNIRANKLPDPKLAPSAGSFFYNVTVTAQEKKIFLKKYPDAPVYKIGAQWEIASAWLIEQVGLKGRTLHGFKISETAPLVLIKKSADSYADLAAAREEIKSAVNEKFGITLQQEPEEITYFKC